MYSKRGKLNLFLRVSAALIGLSLVSGVQADNRKTYDLAVDKVKGDFSVMVLGSGGPIATEFGRASASYLIFIKGEPKILMDAGGGAFQRLAQSGADIKDLDIILLSHLHLDHMGDLSPIVKSLYFHNRRYNVANNITPPDWRTAPFRVFGPAENGATFPAALGAEADTTQYPATTAYVNGLYDLNHGLDRYLNVFTRAISAGIFNYKVEDVSPNWTAYNPETLPIEDENGLVIKAVGVNHGPVPALAFRIEYEGKSVVYSGDTSSRSTNPAGEPLPNGGNMISIAEGADLLIYDTALLEDAPINSYFDIFYSLHTTPSRIGEVATAASVKKLVLSHITPQTEGQGKILKQKIRAQGYHGKIKMAEDLQVYNLLPGKH